MKRDPWGWAILLSQTANWLFLAGQPDETISARAWRQGVLLGDERWAQWARRIDRIFWFQPDHCKSSHEADVIFAREILEIETSSKS